MNRPSNKLLAFLLSLVLLLGVAGAPAFADGDYLVGEVTITATTSVNIRSGGSTDYPIIYKASPGELFQTTGQTTTGWYEILLPDGGFGYVSNGLVYFYAYAVPVPIGAQYTVPVYYRNLQGQTIKTLNVPVRPGQNIITADDSQMPGYRLTSTRSIYVYVDAAGRAVPNGVIFTYEPLYGQTPVTSVTLPIYYKDIYNQLVASEYRALNPGAQLVRADATKLPQGYYISGASDAVVIVSNYGTAAPSELTFTVTRISSQTPVPATFSVPVSYRDQQGNVLLNTSAIVRPGYTTITADDKLIPEGHTLVSDRNVVVYASSQGVTFPSTVVFTYSKPVTSTIQVIYRNTTGTIFYNVFLQLPVGTTNVNALDSRVPEGYVLQGSRSIPVTVYQNGSVSQNQVVFTYAMPVTANIYIEYKDTSNSILYSETRTLTVGTTVITADDRRAPSGYLLKSAREVYVTVNANGSVSTNRVVFTYGPPQPAQVRIVYKDGAGNIWSDKTTQLYPGTHTISANDSVFPAGYALQGARDVRVTVNNDGTANPNPVNFIYYMVAPQGPINTSVRVIYKDGAGNVWIDETVPITQVSTTITANDNRMPAGYTLQGARNVQVTVDLNKNPKPDTVTFLYYLTGATQTKPPASGQPITVLPAYQEYSYKGNPAPVYSCPSTNSYRAANGKAVLGGGRIRIWGSVGDWVMIGYGLSNNLYRIGYVQKSYFPADLAMQELVFDRKPATVVSKASLTDDPIIQPTWLLEIPVGTKVTLLAYENFVNPPHWAYIETTINGQAIRGFVNKIRIQAD